MSQFQGQQNSKTFNNASETPGILSRDTDIHVKLYWIRHNYMLLFTYLQGDNMFFWLHNSVQSKEQIQIQVADWRKCGSLHLNVNTTNEA